MPQEERLSKVYRRNFVAALGVASALLLLYAFYLLRHVALLFAFAGFLAYFLAWPVERLAKRWPRWVAVTTVFSAFVILLLGLVVAIIPVTFYQTQQLVATLPDLIRRVEEASAGLKLQFLPGRHVDIAAYIDHLLNELQKATPNLLQNVYGYTQSFITGTAAVVVSMILIPLITLYFLMDSQRLRAALLSWFPTYLQGDAERALTSVNRSLSSYIYSRVILSAFVGVAVSIMLAILGLPYALLLGVLSFVGEFIPVIGSWISFAIIALVTLATDPLDLPWIIVLTIIIQTFQNYAIAPKLMGDTMDIHPLTVILAMLIGAALGGIAGLVVAIPAAAAAKVIFNIFVLRREDRGITVPPLDLISGGGGQADIQEAPKQ